MSTHFKWYPAECETVVPFNMRYSFPTQANKAIKMTPRIPPKSGTNFTGGSVIRLEFPAQGYVNPGKTTLEFDVAINYDPLDSEFSYLRFQNNIQSCFSRVRLLYGSTPLEDIPQYNVLVRQLTEWSASSKTGVCDQLSISEGIGSVCQASGGIQGLNTFTGITSGTNAGRGAQALYNIRQKYIHGIDMTERITTDANGSVISAYDLGIPVAATLFRQTGSGAGKVPNSSGNPAQLPVPAGGPANGVHPRVRQGAPVRRYQVQLNLGLFNQSKLIPTKFMASQLAIEITLENPQACMYYIPSAKLSTTPVTFVSIGTPSSTAPFYTVSNVNLIPEILEFDSTYDSSFLQGLQTGGVPLKFSTWNNFRFSQSGVGNISLPISERSRSVKAVFAVQRRDPPTFGTDSGACFYTSATTPANNDGATTLQEFQFRIGGRYFPAQAVQCSTVVGGAISNGGCEAFTELSKALNCLGDPNMTTSLNTLKWASVPASFNADLGQTHSILPEFDHDHEFAGFKTTGGTIVAQRTSAGAITDIVTTTENSSSAIAGDYPSCAFAMAIDLETSQGLEISGLNAEEQSDITLIARYQGIQATGFIYDVFTFVDSMIVIKENNVMYILT